MFELLEALHCGKINVFGWGRESDARLLRILLPGPAY